MSACAPLTAQPGALSAKQLKTIDAAAHTPAQFRGLERYYREQECYARQQAATEAAERAHRLEKFYEDRAAQDATLAEGYAKRPRRRSTTGRRNLCRNSKMKLT